MTPRSELLDAVRQLDWFHSIHFDDWTSPGRGPTNGTLRPVWWHLEHIPVEGLVCVDVGTADGIVAFELERVGAAQVVATDGPAYPTFDAAARLLGSMVDYRTGVSDLVIAERLADLTVDLMVMSGLLYHVFSPLATLAQARRVVRHGGLLVVETVHANGDDVVMVFNPGCEPAPVKQPSTYWLPTVPCLEMMLRLVGFEPLGSATNPPKAGRETGRIAVVARAVNVDQLVGRTEQMRRTHEMAGTPHISYRPGPVGDPVPYSGPGGRVELDRKWRPATPLEPAP